MTTYPWPFSGGQGERKRMEKKDSMDFEALRDFIEPITGVGLVSLSKEEMARLMRLPEEEMRREMVKLIREKNRKRIN